MKKILIVEDNKSVLNLLVEQFRSAGYDTHGVPDAMLGTKESLHWRPDLLILDLMLPAGGGVSVLRQFRASVHTKKTPVLVLTGTDDAALRKQILDFGVSSFLKKPHDPQELMALARRALGEESPA